jgi:phosphoribosyl-AMP cyclohydrolase
MPINERSGMFSQLKFDERGLIPVIIQDVKNNEVLMLAYMNEESLEKTIASGKCTYWSRSRQCLWLKGETSGHFQKVQEIYYDCDGDTLLIKVQQLGAACHTGNRTCFYRKLEN